jgi:hypothetical protein
MFIELLCQIKKQSRLKSDFRGDQAAGELFISKMVNIGGRTEKSSKKRFSVRLK